MRMFFLGALAAASLALSSPPPVTAQTLPPITLDLWGQSNNQGKGDSTQSLDVPGSDAREFLFKAGPTAPNYGSGFFRPCLTDPLSRNAASLTSMRSQTGSLGPALATALHDATGRQVLLTQSAVSGTGIYDYAGPGGGEWAPGSQYMVLRDRKVAGMLRSPLCPDSLDFIVMGIGENDGSYLGLYPTTLAEFPDSMQVDSAVDVNGNLVSYLTPRGYPNPNHLANLYDIYNLTLDNDLARYKRVGIVMVQTGLWLRSGSTKLQTRRMMWVQRKLVKDKQAKGQRVWLVRGTETFDAKGWLNADGVHYLQAGLNDVGARVGDLISKHLIR